VPDQKVFALVGQEAAIVAACVAVGRLFHVGTSPNHLVAASGCVLLLGIEFGLVALTVGAAIGSRGVASMWPRPWPQSRTWSSTLVPAVGRIRPARFVSLFYWSFGNNQLTAGLGADEGAAS
jgi:ABC-2 type transport system permease protein